MTLVARRRPWKHQITTGALAPKKLKQDECASVLAILSSPVISCWSCDVSGARRSAEIDEVAGPWSMMHLGAEDYGA